ncbi:uncharacterized protein LOC110712479 [Chenopodium quinoa]|uniref:uncharacterized protein LOC110712479 n=1 Tax=Chenopodium quinoa TaxID=63459 RepID=UPI000B77907B|nr:uncharacterized protein LOC110712479 [Chenopodium quinoa]
MVGDDIPPPPPPAKIEPNSPFYLDAQDKLGEYITHVRLKLENFDAWAHTIYVALSSRRKFGFLDGTINDVVPPATKDDWVTIHCMLVSWLMYTIDPEVKSLLSNYDNAKQLWDDLNERFCVVNGPRIQQLKAEINRCEQTKNMSVAIYFGKLKVLWDDLAKYEPLISYKCGRCTCSVGRQHELRRSRSQDERVWSISQVREEKPEIAGFAVRMEQRPKPRLSRAEKAALTCTHCHKSGHDTTSCFELHGVPSWYTEKYGSSNQDSKGVAKGRSAPPPAGRGRGVVTANATPPPVGASTPQLSGFSAEQWQSLVAAFGTPLPPSNRLNGEWIIDTGCSHHVTGCITYLTNVKDVTPLPVGHPDGQQVMAVKEGDIILTNTITLTNVLFVPKLNDEGGDLARVKDGMDFTTCVRRQQCKGVSAHSVDSSSSMELWHSRLGHPSEKVVKWLPFFSNTTCSLNKDCEVCHRAKHARSSFPLSENKSTRIFE